MFPSVAAPSMSGQYPSSMPTPDFMEHSELTAHELIQIPNRISSINLKCPD
eukprot:COSAG02_NODE_1041_length_15034_cov_96.398326_13_plen_51_part_00